MSAGLVRQVGSGRVTLDGADRDDEREVSIPDLELAARQLLVRHAGEVGDAGQDIAIGLNRDMLVAEHLPEQPSA